MVVAENAKVSVKVGVVVDDWIGKVGLSCIKMALSDFYISHAHYKTRLIPITRDSSNRGAFGAAVTVLNLINNEEVQAILLGVSPSMHADMFTESAEKAQVPIISFSASSPSLSSTGSSYFYQAIESDKIQANIISAMVKYFEWREAVPVTG